MTIRTLWDGLGGNKLLRDLMFPGVAGVVLAIVLGFYEVLRTDPKAAVPLLQSWGPGFLLGALAIAVASSFLGQMVDAQKDGVAAQQKVAVALTEMAARDDRDRDRMLTETQYMAQRMDKTHELVLSMTTQMNRIEARLEERDGRA